jgi:hypothetical protein
VSFDRPDSVGWVEFVTSVVDTRYGLVRQGADVLKGMIELTAQIEGIPMDGMPRLRFFVLFQWAKAVKTAQAIQTLFFQGYAEDAEMLLRVLIEQAVTVKWVYSDNADERV